MRRSAGAPERAPQPAQHFHFVRAQRTIRAGSCVSTNQDHPHSWQRSLEKLDAREALPRLRELLQDDRRSSFGDGTTVAEAARHAIAVISRVPRARL